MRGQSNWSDICFFSENLFLSGESDLNGIITHIDRMEPKFVIIDS